LKAGAVHVSMRDSSLPASVPSEASQGAQPVASPEGNPGSPFTEVLRRLGHELDRDEVGMQAAVGSMIGRSDLAPAQLIALQVGVYRYGDAIDLASRLVDRATSAVKTVLQASGQ
jgi:hypothetical protein